MNQNISANESAYQNREPYTRLLLGPQYCLLRREFTARQQRTRKIAPVARRVLVTMGGSDPEDFTPVALHTLSLIDDELEAAVVVGGSKSKPELANAIAAIRGKKITLHRDVSNMAELMAWADVAISAAGITTWELCLMGLPALLISVAENQTPVAHNLSARGCAIYLGKTKDISVKKIAEQLQFLLQSSERRQLMSSRCRELVDGRGATRVVDALRCATFPGDAQR